MSGSAGKSQTWSRWRKVVVEGLFGGPQGEREMSGMDTGRLNGVGELWLLGPSSPELAEVFLGSVGELVPVEKRNWCRM